MSSDNPYQSPAIEAGKYDLTYDQEMAMVNEEIGPREPFSVVDLLFSFQGRIGRLGYWLVTIGATICYVFTLIGFAVMASEQLGQIDEFTIQLIAWILYLPFGVSLLAAQVKRWHDRGKSGWWCLIGFIPLIGPWWVFIECGFMTGTYGDNRYGNYPLI